MGEGPPDRRVESQLAFRRKVDVDVIGSGEPNAGRAGVGVLLLHHLRSEG